MRLFFLRPLTWPHGRAWMFSAAIVLAAGAAALAADAPALRQVVSLDGTWQAEQGGMESAPKQFTHTVVVPGLIDMAQPAFAEVGVKSKLREAFWYRRTFRLDGPLPAVALLKVNKAMWGTRVILNGTPLGDHLPSFTPGYFDARAVLRAGENEILIRVGAFRDVLPVSMPRGWDYEKMLYTPGIYDSVELILTGSPHIVRVQAVPDIEKKSVAVHAWVRQTGAPAATKLHFTVREASTGQVAGEGDCEIPAAVGDSGERQGLATIAIGNCRLWSPEDPFLYNLEVRGEADVLKTRFGMRTFRLDPTTGRAILNGRPYFMRGSNVTIFRFFEDSERGNKPWREEWVRRLHKAFRDVHWNSLRYCIGFPPESWYHIADEEGILIQDEFPIWQNCITEGVPAENHNADELVREYTEWMQERWNHPCVVLWDACNETKWAETGKAIQKVRGLDFSNRPWDNGYSTPAEPGDSRELHPYEHFYAPFEKIGLDSGTLGWVPGKNPIIINEYGGIWLNRDGTPTALTKTYYKNHLGPHSTTEQRFDLYARYMAADTEFWRSRRACAAVMHFNALGYSRSGEKPRPEGGATSDHWADVEKLAWEPEFYKYVRDAFAPVGIMIDSWAEKFPPGPREFPVVVINDLYDAWKGAVRFRLLRDGATIAEQTQPCEVAPLGSQKLKFTIDIPNQSASYRVEAALVSPAAQPVRSVRCFQVPPAIAAGADGVLRLHARDADLHGSTPRYDPQAARDSIGYWTDINDWVSWSVAVAKPGKHRVQIVYGCAPGCGGEYVVEIGGQKLVGKARDTGGWGTRVTDRVGEVDINTPGRQSVAIRLKTKTGLAVMDLQAVIVQPVAAQ